VVYQRFSVPAAAAETEEEDASLVDHFDSFFERVHSLKEQKARICVCCGTGRSVSPVFILSYFLKSAKEQNKAMTLLRAVQYVEGKERSIDVPDGLMNELIELEVRLFDSASIKIRGRRRQQRSDKNAMSRSRNQFREGGQSTAAYKRRNKYARGKGRRGH